MELARSYQSTVLVAVLLLLSLLTLMNQNTMNNAYICDGLRTPIGRYGGALSSVRPDDMLAGVIKALLERSTELTASSIDDVLVGCANQAGEDNRNVARMACLLAGLPNRVPAVTINRLCGSGLDAVGTAARSIMAGEANLVLAGGVESMSRAPMVMPKAQSAFSRDAQIFDTTIGWRFINPRLQAQYGVDSMPVTAENVATEFGISREDQDTFAHRSQELAAAAIKSGRLAQEIAPVTVSQKRGDDIVFKQDEHPRVSTLFKMSSLPTPFKENGTVTAGNASGVNDGAAAVIVASEDAIKVHALTPMAKIVGMQTVGVEPRIMGIGPAPAIERLLARFKLDINDIDIIELNEAFAAQALAVTRRLNIDDGDTRINANGGAIALGHPLGMSGTRLALTASIELSKSTKRYALCSMCIGVGQGIALLLERV